MATDPLIPIALAIGGNLGDRAATLCATVRRLVAGGVKVDAVSSLYETPPWGYEEQPPFLNGAIRGRTALSPQELLVLAKQIERDLGRAESFRNAPRPVDIDIALYDEQVIDEPGLQIPHPGLPDRAFVLVPLAEIAAQWKHPALNTTIGELRAALGPAEEIKHFLSPARWAYITPEMEQSPPAPEVVIDTSTHPRYPARVLALRSAAELIHELRRFDPYPDVLPFEIPDPSKVFVGQYTIRVAGFPPDIFEPWPEAYFSFHDAMCTFTEPPAGGQGLAWRLVGDPALLISGTRERIAALAKSFVENEKPESASPYRPEKGAIGEAIDLAIQRHENPPATVAVGTHIFNWPNRVYVMGILNATPNSFSDAGKYRKVDDALARAYAMAEEGADMIEVGGQSAQPGMVISVDEELARIVPLLERLKSEIGLPLAVDTFRVGVARGAVEAGAVYINDISGGGDEGDGMARLAAETGVLLGIMHLRGRPKEKQWDTDYESVMDEVTSFLHERIGRAVGVGVAREKIVIDPGLGFGKEAPHDLEVMRRFSELRSFGLPILLATSRKNYLSDTMGRTVHDLLPETAAAVTYGISQGANLIRVHDVAFAARIARLMPHLLGRQ